jgi:hypothetical protein
MRNMSNQLGKIFKLTDFSPERDTPGLDAAGTQNVVNTDKYTNGESRELYVLP